MRTHAAYRTDTLLSLPDFPPVYVPFPSPCAVKCDQIKSAVLKIQTKGHHPLQTAAFTRMIFHYDGARDRILLLKYRIIQFQLQLQIGLRQRKHKRFTIIGERRRQAVQGGFSLDHLVPFVQKLQRFLAAASIHLQARFAEIPVSGHPVFPQKSIV